MRISDPIGARLPSGWRLSTIGEVCDRHGGEVQTGPFGSQLHAGDYVADGIPSVMPKDIVNDRISEVSIARVSKDDALRLSMHQLRVGDIVYARRGDIGRRALVGETEEGWLCGTGCLRIRFNAPEILPKYALAYLGHPAIRGWVELMAQGATMLNLNTSILRSVPLRLPPLSEQRRIAAILDQADGIRRKRQEALRLTEELLRSVFLEMFGDPVTNPRGWEISKLGSTFAERPQIGTMTPAQEVGEQIVVRVGELGNYYVDIERCKRVTLCGKELARHLVQSSDILLARAIGSENQLGKASMLPDTGESVVIDSHVMRLRFDPVKVAPLFFLQWLRTEGGRARLLSKGGRTAVQFNVNASQVSDIDIPLPPIDLQEEFVQLFRTIARLRSGIQTGMDMFGSVFNSLVQRAFRGEL